MKTIVVNQSVFFRWGIGKLRKEIMQAASNSGMYSYKEDGKWIHDPKAEYIVDLRSDTVTRPSKEMRNAIANAIVGDDVFEEDPTVKELESKFAKLLKKEDALFVASGTMGNLLALLAHCHARGSEVIVGETSHIFRYEQGGMAQFGGIQANKIQNLPNGTFSIEVMKSLIREDDPHCPTTSLICIENTNNVCGGRILPLEWIDEVSKVAHECNIPIHMDGARIFNAAIATGVPASRIARDMDSLNICMSKSMGAPMGSVLLGTSEFIAKSRRLRKAVGGGMRQVGMMAAAGIYSLDNLIHRLVDDHKNAKVIANEISKLNNPRFYVDLEQVETNMVIVHLIDLHADEVCRRLAKITEDEIKALGYKLSVLSLSRNDVSIRLVLHLDVPNELVEKIAKKICYVATELTK